MLEKIFYNALEGFGKSYTPGALAASPTRRYLWNRLREWNKGNKVFSRADHVYAGH
jgi:hypothetical protein